MFLPVRTVANGSFAHLLATATCITLAAGPRGGSVSVILTGAHFDQAMKIATDHPAVSVSGIKVVSPSKRL
jgi:hypothetical protein